MSNFVVVKIIRLNDQVSMIDLDALSLPTGTTATINNFSSICDVNIVNPSAGDALFWDGTNWVASAIAAPLSATVTELSSIGDVAITGQSAGDILVWDGANWVSCGAAIQNFSAICDVNIAGASAGDALFWDGSAWVASSIGSLTQLSALTDVIVTAPSGGDVLTWDDTANLWTNRAASMTAPLVDYVTHQYNRFGNPNQAYDANLMIFEDIGPLVVVDNTGDLVYI